MLLHPRLVMRSKALLVEPLHEQVRQSRPTVGRGLYSVGPVEVVRDLPRQKWLTRHVMTFMVDLT